MEAVLGLLVISAGVSHGLETSCDARQNGSQCYGALGGTVYLQLTTRYDELSFYKGSTGAKTEILKMKMGKWVITYTPIEDRVHFFINNGTFRLNNTRRNDSGEYLLLKYDSEGKLSGTRELQLFIKAPVSRPQLSSECLSHGEMRVSCSSEGDGPQYSWTLDGQTLNDTDAPPDNKTNTITLKKGLSGDLTCTVRNYINSDTVSRRISHCPGLIYVNCTLSNGTKISEWVNATGNTLCVEPTTVTTESPTSKTFTVISLSTVKGDSQDVEYADVRILRQEMRQKEREAPVEVEYGQVNEACGPQQPVEVEYGQITILEGPRRKVDMPEEEYCMYASVRKGQ
ncbi:T-cell surface antigen CD2-like isoform X3 [Oncorhynchus nerka]|uniref:T-cell surface antigen CD2-like isoform X3 n=1 Tax=Oncorhynchus nerka TaxID=8023 RepID=UPI00113211E6|nr:SLAM family member 7-like isoform X3 [Oncorhynchus nerka]